LAVSAEDRQNRGRDRFDSGGRSDRGRRLVIADFADRLCSLVESRLPLNVNSDGSEDDWNLVGPAMIAAAARHLRAIAHLQETFPSAIIGWQLVRSMFELVATYAWVAAAPDTHVGPWLKSDYLQQVKLDNNLRELGAPSLEEPDRIRVREFRPDLKPMPSSLVDRTTAADAAWAAAIKDLDGHLSEESRSLRALYPLIYRNGSRLTHPSSHVVARFVTARPPLLVVGEEQPMPNDLALTGSCILALGLVVAVTATPSLSLTVDDIRAALSV
jgi:hypothetical protein